MSCFREHNKIDPSVNLRDLSRRTKNFSGAELEGLVRAAQSSAMMRHVNLGGKELLDPQAVENFMVIADDFEHAITNDIKPAFGRAEDSLEKFLAGGLNI